MKLRITQNEFCCDERCGSKQAGSVVTPHTGVKDCCRCVATVEPALSHPASDVPTAIASAPPSAKYPAFIAAQPPRWRTVRRWRGDVARLPRTSMQTPHAAG